jgi:hypothetical protein
MRASASPLQRVPIRIPPPPGHLMTSQAINEMNAFYAAATASRTHQQLVGGLEWVMDPACDASVTESIRFTAALIIRNLGECSSRLTISSQIYNSQLWGLSSSFLYYCTLLTGNSARCCEQGFTADSRGMTWFRCMLIILETIR